MRTNQLPIVAAGLFLLVLVGTTGCRRQTAYGTYVGREIVKGSSDDHDELIQATVSTSGADDVVKLGPRAAECELRIFGKPGDKRRDVQSFTGCHYSKSKEWYTVSGNIEWDGALLKLDLTFTEGFVPGKVGREFKLAFTGKKA